MTTHMMQSQPHDINTTALLGPNSATRIENDRKLNPVYGPPDRSALCQQFWQIWWVGNPFLHIKQWLSHNFWWINSHSPMNIPFKVQHVQFDFFLLLKFGSSIWNNPLHQAWRFGASGSQRSQAGRQLGAGAAMGALILIRVVKTMPFLPPMTGNGNHTTYKNGDDCGLVYGIVKKHTH